MAPHKPVLYGTVSATAQLRKNSLEKKKKDNYSYSQYVGFPQQQKLLACSVEGEVSPPNMAMMGIV